MVRDNLLFNNSDTGLLLTGASFESSGNVAFNNTRGFYYDDTSGPLVARVHDDLAYANTTGFELRGAGEYFNLNAHDNTTGFLAPSGALSGVVHDITSWRNNTGISWNGGLLQNARTYGNFGTGLYLGYGAWTVSGIVAHGKGARYFIPIKTAQEAAGVENRVSMFYVRSKGNTEATRAEILKLEPNNRVRSIAEYMTLMNSSNLPELKPFIKTMVGIGIVISFLVVFLNMHTLVLERTREIGILKALGFTRSGIAQLLLGETLALTIIGSTFGIALTFLTKAVLTQTAGRHQGRNGE